MKMILNGASKFYQPVTLTEIEEEKNIEKVLDLVAKYNLYKFKS